MQRVGSLSNVIEIWDFEGPLRDLDDRISEALPELIRKHDTLRKGAINALFAIGDITNAGKGIIAREVNGNGVRLKPGSMKVFRAHQAEGATMVISTHNGHSKKIEEIMLKNGVKVSVRHCGPGEKAGLQKELKAENPGKDVISINDSTKEIVYDVAHGLRRKSIFFKDSHNSIPALIMRALGVVKVASEEELDSTIRSVARA